ncbi:S1 family peptidase [Paenibacillus tianmuensis]|uniref:S1 family peptidase n=1 Tax=Paenibacillus tianmuensis TaxID=624147 RepID=UPI001C267869|nr:S1 family peptidase [Paenibacillus tianmuensis]
MNFSKVSFVEQVDQETVGQTVCISAGFSDNTSCGTLESRNWSGEFKDTGYHTNLRKASYSSMKGDSGSTIWAGFTLMGVHTGSGGIYTHVQNAINAMGIYPITTSP